MDLRLLGILMLMGFDWGGHGAALAQEKQETTPKRPFDLERLDVADQRLFHELKGDEILRALAAKATTDQALSKADVAPIVPLLRAAHAKGLPLAALIYPDWMDQDAMKYVLLIEFKRSLPDGSVGWKYVPALVDVFLATCDPKFMALDPQPAGPDGYRVEFIFPYSALPVILLDRLYALAYPDAEMRPLLNYHGGRGANAADLSQVLRLNLMPEGAELTKEQRQMLAEQLLKVEAFITHPPAFVVERWRKAKADDAEQERVSLPRSQSTRPAPGDGETLNRPTMVLNTRPEALELMNVEEMVSVLPFLLEAREETFRLYFAGSDGDVKCTAIQALEKLPLKTQRVLLLRILTMDAAWVPAEISRDSTKVKLFADTGDYPMLFWGGERMMDYALLRANAKRILLSFGITSKKKGGLGREYRQELVRLLVEREEPNQELGE